MRSPLAYAPFVGAVCFVVMLLLSRDADAMPMFARKYHLSCATCHDAPNIPRLNATGYKFRRAGFRMPETIGQDEVEDFSFGNSTSGRVIVDAAGSTTNQTPEDGGEKTRGAFNGEVSLWPLTGSFQKYFASQVELAFSPDGFEMENAYVRGVYGKKNLWLDLRAGVVHPVEGFGASDKPLLVSAPLFETLGAGKLQDTLMRLVEPSRLGAGIGVQWKNTSLTVQAVNGLVTVANNGEVDVEGVLPSNGFSTDLIVFANQIIGDRSGLSLYYSHGYTHPPIDPTAFAAGTSTATWTNPYDRVAAFASVGAGRFTALTGGGIGVDDSRDPVTRAQTRFASGGAFVELDVSLVADVSTVVRVDWFSPALDLPNNSIGAITAGAVWHHEWLYAIAEISARLTQTPTGDVRDGTAILRVAAIY